MADEAENRIDPGIIKLLERQLTTLQEWQSENAEALKAQNIEPFACGDLVTSIAALTALNNGPA